MLYSDSMHELELVKGVRVHFSGNYLIFFDRTQSRSPIEIHMKREELEDLHEKNTKVLDESKVANIANLKRVEREKLKWMPHGDDEVEDLEYGTLAERKKIESCHHDWQYYRDTQGHPTGKYCTICHYSI